jgi:predicted nucleotidyltransferase
MVASEILNEMCRRLEPFQPQQIILFGSQARGTATERSDVDLLVIVPLRERRLEVLRKMYRAMRGIRTSLDIVLLTPEEFESERELPGTIAQPASKEGRVLYVGPAQ